MNRLFDLMVVIVVGAMIADLVTHAPGTTALVNGATSLWSASMKAVNPPSAA